MTRRSQFINHRWPITATLAILLFISTLLLLPFLLLVAFLVSLLNNYRGALRSTLFIICYLGLEVCGIVTSAWLWLRHRNNPSVFASGNFKLQCWWAYSLFAAALRIFNLQFHVHNAEALQGNAVIMLPRHASIADTILPMVYYAKPQNTRLRYVLKKELLWDPCLEIVGNRLPNFFVDRASVNSAAEVAGVIELLTESPLSEGLLLYPEGTRFSPRKRAALRAKAAGDGNLSQQLDRWPDLLPPRLGGCLGLLANNKGHDLLFLAHTGFEGSASFFELMNGSWTNSDVHLEFWRVPFADIPANTDDHKDFLFAQWDRMQQTVERLIALTHTQAPADGGAET